MSHVVDAQNSRAEDAVPTPTDEAQESSNSPQPAEPAVIAVLAALRSRVELGELLPGEQLRQDDLAASLGVSRAPVREALRVLEYEGVAVHHANRGYFVARRTPAELRQLFRMLELLENELCASIAWPDPEVLEAMTAVNDDLETMAALGDIAPVAALNRKFHELLHSLSDAGLVVTEIQRIWALAAPYIARGFDDPVQRTAVVEDHRSLVRALADRRRLALLHAVDEHRSREARLLDTRIG